MLLPHMPLHAVLFPHLPLPLHLFEERYRAMAADLTADDSPSAGRFAVSMITEGLEVVEGHQAPPPTRARQIGTIAEIRSAERFADGRWVLLVVGVARAVLRPVSGAGAYATADAAALPEVAGPGAERLVPEVQAALDRYVSTVKRFVLASASRTESPQNQARVASTLDTMLKPIHLPPDPLAASYAVAGVLQVELVRKQQLLELPDGASRLEAELRMLRDESRLLADGALPPIAAGDIGYHRN